MERSICDLMDELGLRLQLHDAYTSRDDKKARELEQLLGERTSGSPVAEPARGRVSHANPPV